MEDLQVGDVFRYSIGSGHYYWDYEVEHIAFQYYTARLRGTDCPDYQHEIDTRTVTISDTACSVYLAINKMRIISKASQKIEIET